MRKAATIPLLFSKLALFECNIQQIKYDAYTAPLAVQPVIETRQGLDFQRFLALGRDHHLTVDGHFEGQDHLRTPSHRTGLDDEEQTE